MVFHIKGKVALITGGASGIGLATAKEFLKNGAKGITIVDINEEVGKKVLHQIENEFGPKRAIFINASVVDKAQFEDAFKKTINNFGYIDILFNNAGVAQERNWEHVIDINFKGTVHGILLAFENYIQKYKSDVEGVIINSSSIAGVNAEEIVPIYSGTKFAITGMTKAFGHKAHYERTGVKVIAIAPGCTDTPLLRSINPGTYLGEQYEKLALVPFPKAQSPEVVAKAVINLTKEAKSGTIWVIEDEVTYEYIIPDRRNYALKK